MSAYSFHLLANESKDCSTWERDTYSTEGANGTLESCDELPDFSDEPRAGRYGDKDAAKLKGGWPPSSHSGESVRNRTNFAENEHLWLQISTLPGS